MNSITTLIVANRLVRICVLHYCGYLAFVLYEPAPQGAANVTKIVLLKTDST